jgi:hypothetical protein
MPSYLAILLQPILFNSRWSLVILILYVDNLSITNDHLERIEWFKCQLQKRFEMKNLGDMSHYLKIKFIYFEEGIFVTQKKYVIRILE